MGLFEQLPYTNFHELNLTELIKELKRISYEMENFKVINKITYRGTWDITKQYPAWSVVASTDGSIGYISIKPVPVGVDILNTDYWVLVADFTVQLAGIGARVDALEDDVDAINTRITNIVNAPKRRYILIGDSFSLGVVGGGAPRGTGWAMYAVPKLEEINERAYRYHPESGEPIEGVAGFAGGVFIQYLQRVESDELDCDNSEITDIIVLGGSNEFGFTTTQIKNAIGDFCNYCDTHFPNAHVSIGLIGLQADRLFSEVWAGYSQGATENGASYIDTCLNLMLDPQYDSGYGHITPAGYNYINPFVLECIRFGKTSYVQNFSIDCSLGSDVTIPAGTFDFKMYAKVTEKTVLLEIMDSQRFNPFSVKLNTKTGTSLSGNVFTLSNDVYFPVGDVCEAKAYLCSQTGYQYTPVRSGHFFIQNHNKVNYSFGFPYNNTWSSSGIDSATNDCYAIWERGITRSI